jgi:hypothetical protein
MKRESMHVWTAELEPGTCVLRPLGALWRVNIPHSGGVEVAQWKPKSFQLIRESYMIILTDPSRERYDSFHYALPQGHEAWDFWRAAAARYNSFVMGIANAYRVNAEGKVDLVLLLPDEHHTDEEVETAAAHLRISEKYEGKMFVMRRGPAATQITMTLAATSEDVDMEDLAEGIDMGDGDAS